MLPQYASPGLRAQGHRGRTDRGRWMLAAVFLMALATATSIYVTVHTNAALARTELRLSQGGACCGSA